MDRESFEEKIESLYGLVDAGRLQEWIAHFAEGCVFNNSALPQPLQGRAAILDYANSWPPVIDITLWTLIEGDRVAIGWKERHKGATDETPWCHGVLTLLLDGEGRVCDYMNTFDPRKMAAAMRC